MPLLKIIVNLQLIARNLNAVASLFAKLCLSEVHSLANILI